MPTSAAEQAFEALRGPVETRLPKNNKSGHRGVYYDKAERRWRARVMVDGRRYFLGFFDTSEEAGRAVAAFHAEIRKVREGVAVITEATS